MAGEWSIVARLAIVRAIAHQCKILRKLGIGKKSDTVITCNAIAHYATHEK